MQWIVSGLMAGRVNSPGVLKTGGRLSPYLLAVVLTVVACLGCSSEKETGELDSLPLAEQTHHAELRAELDRLKAEKATPELLDKIPKSAGGGTTKERAARLVEELNAIYPRQDLRLALQQIEQFYPQSKFAFDPIKLQRALEVQRRSNPELQAYRELFRRRGFRFDVSLSDGLLADLVALDHATLAHRLEAIVAADELAAGEAAAALSSLRNMLLIDSKLAAVASVAARSTAARLRAEAYAVVEALVVHPKCGDVVRDELRMALETHLNNWTPDHVTWMGDRALGLHAFELVRDGQLFSILTAEEIKELEAENDLKAFDKAVLKSLDDDEWFYLSVMRRVIEACDQPFYQRGQLFEEINREMERLWNTPRCPIFAANVLLPDMAAVQRQLAIDRARCEAWVIALNAAAGTPLETPGVNPVTGKSYELVREVDDLLIRGLTSTRDTRVAVRIPLLGE